MEKCAQTNSQLPSELVVALGIWTVVLRALCCCSSAFVGQVLFEEFGRFFWDPSISHSCESSRARARLLSGTLPIHPP